MDLPTAIQATPSEEKQEEEAAAESVRETETPEAAAGGESAETVQGPDSRQEEGAKAEREDHPVEDETKPV